jgi:hypothetical protein
MLPRLPLLTTLRYAPRPIHTYARPLSFCACVCMCVAVPVCVPMYGSAVCTSAICLCVHRRLCLCLCLSVCAEGHDDVITAIVPLCLSLSLSLGPSLCVCVRRPHPDSEGGMCLWPRGHSLDNDYIDAALLQQIEAFMQQPAAASQAEGTRPLASHRQSHRRWLLQYRPVCAFEALCMSVVVAPSVVARTCPCVCVPASLCLRPMRHTHTGTCVCIANVCVPDGCPCIGCVGFFLCLFTCLTRPRVGG